MYQLVILTVSLALFAVFTATFMNYVPVEAYTRQATQTETLKYLSAMEGTVSRYFNTQRDGSGNIIYPGDGVNLMPIMTPGFGFSPPDIRGLTWQVTTGTIYGQAAVGICVLPQGGASATTTQREVMGNIQHSYPVGSTFIGSSCNAGSDVAGGDHMTYWIILRHLG